MIDNHNTRKKSDSGFLKIGIKHVISWNLKHSRAKLLWYVFYPHSSFQTRKLRKSYLDLNFSEQWNKYRYDKKNIHIVSNPIVTYLESRVVNVKLNIIYSICLQSEKLKSLWKLFNIQTSYSSFLQRHDKLMNYSTIPWNSASFYLGIRKSMLEKTNK